MSKRTYEERLAGYIHHLPTATKNLLLGNVALLVFNDEDTTPTSKLATFDRLTLLLSELRPELHAPYDREALTQALGEYLTDWWGESLDRPLTGRDLDQLLDNLPEYGIREALKSAAEKPDTVDGTARPLTNTKSASWPNSTPCAPPRKMSS